MNKEYTTIPIVKDDLINRNKDMCPLEVRYGIFVLDEFYRNFRIANGLNDPIVTIKKYKISNTEIDAFYMRCKRSDFMKYTQKDITRNKIPDRIKNIIYKLNGSSWIKYYRIIDGRSVECSASLILETQELDEEEFIVIMPIDKIISILHIDSTVKNKEVIYIHPWVYSSRYNLTKYQIRLYELYYLWRGNKETYPISYEYIKDFFGINYKDMGTFKQEVLNKAILDMRKRNIMDIEILKVRKGRKYNYIFKFKKLTGGIK